MAPHDTTPRPPRGDTSARAGLEHLEPRRLFSASALVAALPAMDGADGAAQLHASALPPVLDTAPQEGNALHRSHDTVPLSQVPVLHSNPGSDHTLYLDFNGMTVNGTVWNNFYFGGDTIHAPAFDLDGDIDSFNDLELEQIVEVWHRVAEDFAPFDLDVTTEAPPGHHITQGSRAIRILISSNIDSAELGGTGDAWHDPAGGAARINSWQFPTATPAWVFSNHQQGSAKFVAEAVSHEAGHTFGLDHDGIAGGEEYFEGHGSGATSWAPIMGSSYTNNVTQWSRGEYDDADNTEDDLAVITRPVNGFGYRADDHGNQRNDATEIVPLFGGRSVGAAGIITTAGDIDYFSFETGGGTVTIDINPARYGANLDIKGRLYDAGGSVVSTSNSSSQLKAGFDVQLSAGQYFISVEGTGAGDPDDSGYSSYASLGQYHLVGSIQPMVTLQFPPPPLGDLDGDYTVGSGDLALVTAAWGQQGAGLSADLDGDGQVGAGDLDTILAQWGAAEELPSHGISRVHVPTDGGLGLAWTAPGFDDKSWDIAIPGVGYETSGNQFDGLIQTPLPSGTLGAYVRTGFTVADASDYDGLGLTIRFDDGFAAYLNGVLVASHNAPDGPQWDDRATDSNDDDDSQRFAWFDLSAHLGLLQDGDNTLAVHVMNASSSSTDLLVDAEIVGWTEPGGAQAALPPASSAGSDTGGAADGAPLAAAPPPVDPAPSKKQQALAAWAKQRAAKPADALAPAPTPTRGNSMTPRHVIDLLR